MNDPDFWGQVTTAYRIDVQVAVGAEIVVRFHVHGALQGTATAANTGAKGRPVSCEWGNDNLHGSNGAPSVYYAHIAVLDGVSTIGRRFAWQTPDAAGTYAQMRQCRRVPRGR
jgi:hypothetical protein